MVNNSTFTISTKRTNISHLKPLNTKTRYMTFYVQVQRSGMVKSIMGSQTPSDREWLLIGANSAIFRSWIFIVLAHWNKSLWIDISPTRSHYPDFEPTSPWSFSLVMCAWAKNQLISILYSLVWPDRDSNPQCASHEASMLTITPPIWFTFW